MKEETEVQSERVDEKATNATSGAPGTLDELAQFLERERIPFERDVALSERSYMRTGGRALVMILPATVDALARAIAELHRCGMSYKVIGNTSNLLFLDDCDYSVLISTLALGKITFDRAKGVIGAECGTMMPVLARVALWNSITGFEGLEGIPGTIGGGLFMNAGAYGTELKDRLATVEVIRSDGRLETVPVQDLGLSHRGSALRRGDFDGIVASCTFRAEPGDAAQIFARMEVFHAKRHKYQDFMYPNLGSLYSGSPYRALARKNWKFKAFSALFYLFRYEFKIFHRESPINRKWLNDLALRTFDFDFPIQPFSDKTLNCLVNRGQGTAEMLRFIRFMEDMVGHDIPIENEIVEGF